MKPYFSFVIIVFFLITLPCVVTATMPTAIGVLFNKSNELDSLNKFWIGKYVKENACTTPTRKLTISITFFLETNDSVYSATTTQIYLQRASAIINYLRQDLTFQGEIIVSYTLEHNKRFNKVENKYIDYYCTLSIFSN